MFGARAQGAEIHAGLALLPQLLAPQATVSRWPCARPVGSCSAAVGRDGWKGGQCGGARGGWWRRKGKGVERGWRGGEAVGIWGCKTKFSTP